MIEPIHTTTTKLAMNRKDRVELSALRAERRARLSDFRNGRGPCDCNTDVSYDVCWMCDEIEEKQIEEEAA